MSLVGKLQGMISTVPHGTGIPSRYKRNCDNSIYIFCIRVKHIINILSWDTIEPRYFFRAQGQSFHSYTIGIALSCSFCNHRIRISVKNIKCFLQVRVDQHEQRHRQRRVRIWTVTDICMNTYLDSDRQNIIDLHIAAEDCCYVRSIVSIAGVTFTRVCVVLPGFDVGQWETSACAVLRCKTSAFFPN